MRARIFGDDKIIGEARDSNGTKRLCSYSVGYYEGDQERFDNVRAEVRAAWKVGPKVPWKRSNS